MKSKEQIKQQIEKLQNKLKEIDNPNLKINERR
jgi:hypothetical protein